MSDRATGDLETDLTKLFVSIGEASQSCKKVIVLLVDEMHFVSKKDLEALIMALHKISQRQLPLLMFGAGLPQLSRIMGNAKSYAERLFDYPEIGKLDNDSARQALVEPAKRRKVDYDEGAISTILEETGCYPYFLQLWGSYAWEVASASPITDEDAREATKRAINDLMNKGFFKVRLERFNDRQRDYARAMAELMPPGPGPSAMKEVDPKKVEELLGLSPSEAGRVRRGVIEKGLAYIPNPGRVAFTVPRFDEFIRDAWELTAHKRRAQPRTSRRSKKRKS